MAEKYSTTLLNILLLLILVFTGLSNTTKMDNKFKRKLRSHDVQFYMPQGFVVAPSIQHNDLPNEFTISKSLDEFEIRYAIHGLKKEIKAYQKNIKNPTVKLIHPNLIWRSTLQERITKLASKDGVTPRIREFSEEAFGDQLKGDAGGICFFQVSESIQLGYKYAIIMVIHRNFVADLNITFLGNDPEKLQDLSLDAFHAMIFKK